MNMNKVACPLYLSSPNSVVSYQMDFDGDGVIDYTGDTLRTLPIRIRLRAYIMRQ